MRLRRWTGGPAHTTAMLALGLIAGTAGLARADDSDGYPYANENVVVNPETSPDTTPVFDGHGFWPIGDITRFPQVARKIPTIFFDADELPPRPPPLLELGDPFLDTGNLSPGFDMPGGAVWQPRLWVYGDVRSAMEAYGNNNGTHSEVGEWANRIDAYANLQLTGTERILLGIRPLDRDRSGEFSGYDFTGQRWNNGLNGTVSTLFFEGDLGSTVPDLDSKGDLPVDLGYSVGRQPLQFQNGIMVNDTVDSVGLVRNNLHVPGASQVRITPIYAWRIDRPNRPAGEFGSASMAGADSSTELLDSTLDLDAVYVGDNSMFGDGVYSGAAFSHRYGLVFGTVRVNNSWAVDHATDVSTNGTLVSGEFSMTPYNSDDNVYVDPFVALGNYSSAAQDPMITGPLAPLGILFSGYGYGTSYGVGTLTSALSAAADNVAGFAAGYQAFYGDHAENITFEIGGRDSMDQRTFNALGFGVQYQHALTQRVMFQINISSALQEAHRADYGLRSEVYVQF